MPRVFEDFGNELEAEEYEDIANKVYNQIKLSKCNETIRMLDDMASSYLKI